MRKEESTYLPDYKSRPSGCQPRLSPLFRIWIRPKTPQNRLQMRIEHRPLAPLWGKMPQRSPSRSLHLDRKCPAAGLPPFPVYLLNLYGTFRSLLCYIIVAPAFYLIRYSVRIEYCVKIKYCMYTHRKKLHSTKFFLSFQYVARDKSCHLTVSWVNQCPYS